MSVMSFLITQSCAADGSLWITLISLNQRDPLNTAVNFDHIDSACDAIWMATK